MSLGAWSGGIIYIEKVDKGVRLPLSEQASSERGGGEA
jgi:hypothetical protein